MEREKKRKLILTVGACFELCGIILGCIISWKAILVYICCRFAGALCTMIVHPEKFIKSMETMKTDDMKVEVPENVTQLKEDTEAIEIEKIEVVSPVKHKSKKAVKSARKKSPDVNKTK